MKIIRRSRRKLALLVLSGLVGMTLGASAANRTWTAGGSSNDWSDPANWNNSQLLATGDLPYFRADGLIDDPQTPGNRVTSDFTLSGLWYYRYNSSKWHTTEIAEGVTLKLTGAAAATNILLVGNYTSATTSTTTTQAAIIGKGTLLIDQSDANISLGGSLGGSPVPTNTSLLDLSGLSRFQATVNRIDIGIGNKAIGFLKLAEENAVTANQLFVGFSNGNLGNNVPEVTASELVLGRSNLLQINNIYIGASPDATRNTSSGVLYFAEGLTDATVTIRGTASGDSAARMVVGGTGGTGQNSRSQGGVADFTGGEIDAILSELTIAHSYHSGSSVSQLNGYFAMDRGTVDALEVNIALGNGSSGTSTTLTDGRMLVGGGQFSAGTVIIANNQTSGQNIQGSLEVGGGEFLVTGKHAESNDAILLGNRGGTAASIKASILLSGGLLSVTGGNINTGVGAQIESTITLSGGAIDLHGHQVTIDLLTLESGHLLNLGEFNTRATTGATLAKTSTGIVTVGGLNTYSGLTDVREGTLLLEQGAELRNTSGVLVRGGATFGGIGIVGSDITVEELGTIALTLSLAPADALRVGGGITLAADTNLELTLQEAPVTGSLFRLIEVNGGQAINGTFATLNGEAFLPGDTFSLSFDEVDYTFRLIYGDGSDLHGYHLFAQAIPEPAEIAFLAMGAVVLGVCRWRSTRAHMLQS